MAFNIVLIEPEIPNNTGNIGRLALATGCQLHLVKPFGFDIEDKQLKRAGLDYWQHLDLKIYDNIECFFKANLNKKMVFLSSHGRQDHWDIPYEDELFIIFGKESVGLPKALLEKHETDVFKIPLFSAKIRSLNLANAVSVVIYEGLRTMR